jgi:hypothetical protein
MGIASTLRGRGCAIVFACSAALAAPSIAAATTVSSWQMDEPTGTTMRDSVGGNDGTLHNVLLGQPGATGLGYGFNGTSSVVTVPTAPSLNPGNSPFWMSVQVKFTKTPTAAIGGDYDVIRKGLSATSGGFYKMELLPSNGGVRLHCSMEGSKTSRSLTTGPDLRDGNWHTIQCLKDDSSISGVVDGAKETDSIALGSFGNNAPLAVGAKAEGGDWYEGILDNASFGTGLPGDIAPPINGGGSGTSTSATTGVVGPAPGAAPTTVVSQPETSSDPVSAGTDSSCVHLRPGSFLRKAKLEGDARLTLQFDAQTGALQLRAPRGMVRQVVLTLDGKRVTSARGGSLHALVRQTQLAPGVHVMRATVHPRRGKVLTLTVHLTSTSC